jgi:SAM-dependent methyltransferase
LTGYEEDLAYIHHAGFTGFAEQAAVRILELLRERGIRSGLVVELGCGSGVTARALTEAGYDVLGIDSSPAMVRLARRTAPLASFRVATWPGRDGCRQGCGSGARRPARTGRCCSRPRRTRDGGC